MKTTEPSTGDALGSAVARAITPSVIELRFVGHGSRATATRVFERASGIAAENPRAHAVVFDLHDSIGWDPGNVALGIAWFKEHGGRFDRIALLTRSHAVAALTNVAKVLLPGIESRVCATRDEAVAWCESETQRPAGRGRRFRAA